jgi:hypothetical protein
VVPPPLRGAEPVANAVAGILPPGWTALEKLHCMGSKIFPSSKMFEKVPVLLSFCNALVGSGAIGTTLVGSTAKIPFALTGPVGMFPGVSAYDDSKRFVSDSCGKLEFVFQPPNDDLPLPIK